MSYSLGRYVYGLAAIGFGICALAFHDVSNWLQIKALGDLSHSGALTAIVGIVQILGGVAVAWPRTARAGALALGALYVIFALLTLPYVIRHPLVYNGYGNFFEQLSFVSGAVILYARTKRLARIGYYSFGLCVVSFALEQLFYLSDTAGLVPKWIPPGQMFWAIATTAAFALAAIALLTGIMARLASRLNTAMIVGFGLLVWVPALVSDPHGFSNWTEGLETLGIAGSAWIVADFLN
jgi:uncharacterized membrane protein YphA (DoxX/SURF4 family)